MGITVFRPTFVYGIAPAVNMNPLLPLLVYAAVLRERGKALSFPGRHADHLREAVSADLIGTAATWARRSPAAADETFNLTNGDLFTWAGVWPAIADRLGMAVGQPTPVRLSEWLPAHGDEWSAVVQRHGLHADPDVTTFVGANSLLYADLVLGALDPPAGADGGPPPVIVNSTIKVRHAGFEACVDTEDMFVSAIDAAEQWGLIPPPHATGP